MTYVPPPAAPAPTVSDQLVANIRAKIDYLGDVAIRKLVLNFHPFGATSGVADTFTQEFRVTDHKTGSVRVFTFVASITEAVHATTGAALTAENAAVAGFDVA